MAATTLTVVSPYDLSELESLPFDSAEDREQSLSSAHALSQEKPIPIWERVEILEKAACLLDERKAQFALTIAQEGGKPLKDAEVEAARAVEGIRIAIEVIRNEDGKTVPMGLNPASANRLAFTAREPIGVVVAISAFNHPLNLIVHQVCVSVQRVFAHADLIDELSHRLAEFTRRLVTGDPTQPNTDVGPLILPRENDRIEGWVREASSLGAKVLLGGKKISETCFEPTLLCGAPAKAKVSQLEIFGPVISVYEYSDMDSAIDQANALPVAFQASVFTRDIDRAMQAAKGLDASAVMINDHTAFRVDWMPFAGRKTSGLGIGGIPYTMEDMTQEKMIVFKSPCL